MMRPPIICVAVFFGLFSLSTPGQASDGPKARVEMLDEQTISFVPRGEIEFKGSYGEVRIDGWDRSEVGITVRKALSTDDTPADRAKKQERLKEIKLTTTRAAPDKLAISSRVPSVWFHNSVQLVYEIRVPKESDLRVRLSAGEISCRNVTGELNITEHFGEISVALPDGDRAIDAKARIGDVSSQFPVKTRRPNLVGATATGVKGVESPVVYLRVGIGQINVTRLAPKAAVRIGPGF